MKLTAKLRGMFNVMDKPKVMEKLGSGCSMSTCTGSIAGKR